MWSSWPQASTKKPSYLLLIGDHEDAAYSSEDWFLPTHVYDFIAPPSDPRYNIGNDEWYAYFNDDRDIDNDIPNIMVGRLSVKNGTTPQTDTLSILIENLIDLEDPIIQIPNPDNRRRIVRLAGTGKDHGDGYQTYESWAPNRTWTLDFSNWLDYEYSTDYCGDGRDFIDKDGSLMASYQWRDSCLTEFGRGAGVIFYSNHGDYHMFSAGLEWLVKYIPLNRYTKGARDSTFNNYQVINNLVSTQNHSAPFALLLCCSAGTYNHTVDQHENRIQWPELCYFDGNDTPPVVAYDFGSDCLGERLLKNTSAPVAGVFCGSQTSGTSCYRTYGEGILEAVYSQGCGRLGDAIMATRMDYWGYKQSTGTCGPSVGQFNLLGDPALDISDRVRYPNDCDLVVYAGNIIVSEYPEETSTGIILPISFRIHNNGRQNSDSFTSRVTFSHGVDITTSYVDCSAIVTGEYKDYEYSWDCPNWFDPPMEVTITIDADYQHSCDDSWWSNNSASTDVQLNDTYPFNPGWPVSVDGCISTTPVLVNLDVDSYLEVVALTGTSLTAFDHDGSTLWQISAEGLSNNQFIAADLDQDGDIELILACDDGSIITISNSGDVLDNLTTSNKVFAVGNMDRRAGLELCTAEENTLYLYYWDATQEEFSLITSKDLGFSRERPGVSLVCSDLGGDTYNDVAYLSGFQDEESIPAPPKVRSITVYDWSAANVICLKEWSEYLLIGVHLSAGMLSGSAMVGYPLASYLWESEAPALLIEPGSSTEFSCEEGTCNADELRFGVFADWDPFVSGADAFVLPSEMQCLAWNEDGDPITGWPTDEYLGADQGSLISPTALGDLDGDGVADALFSTELSGKDKLLAFDSDGEPLDINLDFPFTLPDGVSALGGFSIADIDRDGDVEIVFGTSDGLLHCWELGTCSTGYAPWTQFQHDSGRTGVLD